MDGYAFALLRPITLYIEGESSHSLDGETWCPCYIYMFGFRCDKQYASGGTEPHKQIGYVRADNYGEMFDIYQMLG